MFYEQNQINSKLKCPKCKNRFQDPRILPCGETVCNLCIKEIVKKADTLNEKADEFMCIFCTHMHKKPSIEGFISCKFLNSLMSEKPSEIYCGKNLEKLKTNLNTINMKIEKMNNDLKHGVNIIKEYCGKLRKEVKSSKETMIENINEMAAHYLKKIDNYENECIAQFELKENENTSEKNKLSFYNFINESHLFYKSWIYYINKGQIDESELLKAIGYTESRLFKIKKEQVGINYFLFNKDILIFKKIENIPQLVETEQPAWSKSAIGELYHEKIHGINFDKLEKIDLRRSFDETNPILLKVSIECIDDMGLVFAVIDSAFNFKLKLFSNNGTLLKNYFHRDNEEAAIAEDHSLTIKLKDFRITKTKTNLIVLYKEIIGNIQTHEQNELIPNERRIEVLNDAKNKRYSIKCQYKSPLLSSNDSNIFLFEQNAPSGSLSTTNSNVTIYIYDFELNLLKSINHKLSFIEKPIIQFECEYEKIYLLDEEHLSIINKNSGELIFDIELDEKMRENKFSISHQELVLMNEKNKKIIYYSKVNGNILYEDELVNCASSNLVMACEKLTNKIIFFDKSELFLYI